MLKKLASFGLSAMFIFAGAASASPYYMSSDEERAARSQQREMNRYKSRDLQYKISQVRSKISSNEAEIKRLERKRTTLDGELAVKLQLKEEAYSWFEIARLNREISRIQSDISWNESRIASLKEKRSSLKQDLVVLQLQEV